MDDDPPQSEGFLAELKRRRVVRVALIYGAGVYALLEGAELVLSALQAPEWVISLLVMTAIVGFPITLALSWVFDFTPQGIRRTGPPGDGPSPTWLSSGSITVLAGIAVAFGAGWWLTDATGAGGEEAPVEGAIRSVAVLPFENVGAPEDDYFADGLGDALRDILSSSDGLDVAARASSFQMRGTAADPVEVGERLGVQAVLRGRVDKSEDLVRVEAELVPVEAGAPQLWGGQYERVVTDIFRVQSEIAAAIAAALDRGEPVEATEPTNAMAYDKYLWGTFNVERRTPGGVRDAIDNFSMAIGFDSAYAPAWTGLAESYVQQLELGVAADPGEAIDAGLAAAETASRLDPTSLDTRTTRAYFHALSLDWAEAEQELAAVVATNPSSSSALVRHAEVLTALGRSEQAVARARAAIVVDRLSPQVRRAAAGVLAAYGSIDEAIAESQEALALTAPEDAGLWTEMGFLFLAAGRYEDAPDAFHRAAELTGVEFAVADDFLRAAEGFARGGAPGRVPVGAIGMSGGRTELEALYHAAVGDVEGARARLTEAVDHGGFGLAFTWHHPLLEPVRAATAFGDLERRAGLSP